MCASRLKLKLIHSCVLGRQGRLTFMHTERSTRVYFSNATCTGLHTIAAVTGSSILHGGVWHSDGCKIVQEEGQCDLEACRHLQLAQPCVPCRYINKESVLLCVVMQGSSSTGPTTTTPTTTAAAAAGAGRSTAQERSDWTRWWNQQRPT